MESSCETEACDTQHRHGQSSQQATGMALFSLVPTFHLIISHDGQYNTKQQT